ncbi:MAG: SusC/RagA family TonB-linked outer membrane protein [Chitinophagaceae bacterium]
MQFALLLKPDGCRRHLFTSLLMRWNTVSENVSFIPGRTTLLAMKLTILLLLFSCLAVSATGNAQKISIDVKNASLTEVFERIEKQTAYTFAYTGTQLQLAKKVSITISNGTLDEVLALCFKEQPFTYSIIDKTVVVKPKDPGLLPSPSVEKRLRDEVPPITIKGRIVNENGDPVIASVMVKGTRNGATTNTNGEFEIKGIDENAVLVVSGVNIEKFEIKVKGRTNVSLTAKTKVTGLEEVTVNKGYYTETQKLSVSNTVRVTAKEIERQPVQNVVLALQGRVPGLFVTQGTGNAGSSIKVRIQGQNSLRNGSDPLYVVDGVQIDANLPNTGIDGMLGTTGGIGFNGFGSPLNFLNPLDIESVEVLKDADATAIYGSRAANGAILITTKKGKAGDLKFDLNMETGWGKMTRRVDMMNTRQYLDMRYEAFANDGIDWTKPNVSANDLKVWDTTRYTNWQDELLGGTARYNNINASVSGGSRNVGYLVSGTYHKETTVFPLPKDFADQKASVHFNINANSTNQKFRMQFSGNYMFDDNQLPAADFTREGLLMEPNAPPLLNADGSINWAPDAAGNTTWSGEGNVMVHQYTKYVNKTHNLVSSLKLDYAILPGLNIGSSFGYNYMQTNDFSPSPLIAVAPELRASTQRGAAFGNRNLQSWIIEPQASYRAKIKKGTLDLLLGSTFQDKKAAAGYIYAQGQTTDEVLDNMSAAAHIFAGSSSTSSYRYAALFGRVNYNWDDKYIFSINARRDGSTRFGADKRFHNFGSVGAAWLFSNERFFKNNFEFVSFGKIRGNFGTTGSDQIGDYQFMSLYNFFSVSAPYQGIVGLIPAGLPNPKLGWEETKKLQLGVDLGFFQDKLVVNANYVRNRSSNQLLGYALPNQAGFTSVTTNFPATVQNQNWEFMVTGKIIQKKEFSWTSSINLTIPQNKLIRFDGLSDSNYSYKVGFPIDATPYFHWLGVAAGTGDYLFADGKGRPTIAPGVEDLNVRRSKFPKFYGGFQNSVVYKGLQLDFIFQFVKQFGYKDVLFWNQFWRYPGMFAPGVSNQPVTVLNRWQKPGDNNKTVARYSTYEVPYILGSDRRFADITYISLKNVSLSYELPQKWVSKAKFRNFRVYMHAQNLWMLSNYKGLNPETQNMTSLPPLQVWTVGVQLGL